MWSVKEKPGKYTHTHTHTQSKHTHRKKITKQATTNHDGCLELVHVGRETDWNQPQHSK
jgi:hypothetical protein